MDSLFEQGYRGRRNTLIVGVHGTASTAHCPVELVSTALSSTTSLVKLRQPALPARYRHGQQTAF